MEAGRGRKEGVVKGGGGGKSGKQKVVTDARDRGKRRFYLLLGGIAIAGITILAIQATRGSATSNWTVTEFALVPNQGHVIGSDSAPIEVVEFADFECPACGQFANLSEPDVRARLVNTGQIRFRFMDFPLEGHRNTQAAHLAAWCAGEQNKFWEMHDAIFAAQDRWSGYATTRPNRVLADLARGVGANMDQYDSCVSSKLYAGQIQSNYDAGVQRAVGSTPTFFIGNRKVVNAIPYDEFKRHVDEVLAETRAKAATSTPPTDRAPTKSLAPTKTKSP
jgi:protein-disulfide isomerase